MTFLPFATNELKNGFLRIWTGCLKSYILAQYIETGDFHISLANFLNDYVITTFKNFPENWDSRAPFVGTLLAFVMTTT